MPEDEIRVAMLKVDRLLKSKQTFWEPAKATAMILIAAAAISAAGGSAGYLWPQGPQQITVKLEQPLAVKMQ